MPKYSSRRALPSDAPFLAIGIINAERDLHSIGIWDIWQGRSKGQEAPVTDESTKELAEALAWVALNSDPLCLYNYNNFTVVQMDADNSPVGCCCSFVYPETDIQDTFKYLTLAYSALFNWTEVQAEAGTQRVLAFIDESYPQDVEYEGRLMIEGVFVLQDHRRKGLATKCITSAMYSGLAKRNDEIVECLISCSTGNEGAQRAYEKLGFAITGSVPFSQECFDSIGTGGFMYLKKDLH